MLQTVAKAADLASAGALAAPALPSPASGGG